jgi:hypothetical protein
MEWNKLKEWIEDGITIRKTNDGYQVFTIPTQHFEIKELNELTSDRFKAEVDRQTQVKEWEAGLFKDLFD